MSGDTSGNYKTQPELQTEFEGDGPGKPPRRTAIGLEDGGANPNPSSPAGKKSWWQRLVTIILNALWKNLLVDEPDSQAQEGEKAGQSDENPQSPGDH
jgi:hypothetical protein